MEPGKNANAVKIAVAVIVVLALVAYGGWKYFKKDTTGNENTVVVIPKENEGTPTGTGGQVSTTKYKNGTYSSLGSYLSPGGEEEISLTLTLKDDTVTEATVVSHAIRPESKIYQGKFISGFKTLVVGKKIGTISLDKVSGSSLTPKGFADALAKIKTQAEA